LEQDVQARGLQGRVQLVGALPHHSLGDWFRAASIFVLPSYSEGVPCVLLEAAACGTPFVASRVGGIPEIAHLGVNLLVPPGDARALADALRHFLTTDGPAPMKPVVPMRDHAQAASELTAVFERVLQAPRLNTPVSTAS
jgi:glycosyltransferase involved in cell wall biosynthesis